MKLLFIERNALMQQDMESCLQQLNISYRVASYVFHDTDHDPYFTEHLQHFLTEDGYDAVFSFNFIPVIADVCYDRSVPYISWGYDAGWECHRKDAFNYPTNFIFHFDKKACEEYQKSGLNRVFYQPLAINFTRLDRIQTPPAQMCHYTSDIAYLGALYENYLDDFEKFFPKPVMNRIRPYLDQQITSYGKNTLWDDINEEYVQSINDLFSHNQKLGRLNIIALYAGYITHFQRLSCLNKIANSHKLDLWTTSGNRFVPNANYRWRANYYSDMPHIFRNATINLNITLQSIQTGMTLRVMDILGAGGFLLSNDQAEFHDYFQVGRDLETFASEEELLEKVSFYLSHPDIAGQIATSGNQQARAQFKFPDQFRKILQTCGFTTS